MKITHCHKRKMKLGRYPILMLFLFPYDLAVNAWLIGLD